MCVSVDRLPQRAQISATHIICLKDFVENDYGDKTVHPLVKMQTLKLV